MVIVKKPIQPPNEVTCDMCGAVLCYEPTDIRIGYMGYEVIDCPECGEDVAVSEKRVAAPEFPVTFAHSDPNGERVKNLSNEEVQQYVDKVVQKCECLKAGEFTFAATGDTMVIGLKFEDETDIIVAKDYYEDAIMDED